MRRALVFLFAALSMKAQSTDSAMFPDTTQLEHMAARFAPTPLTMDVSHLNDGDRNALIKLIEAGRVVDDIFLQQLWKGNERLYQELRQDTSPLGKARLHLFWIYKGPWADLEGHRAFLPDVPERKPPGANFYPEDMTRPEFEQWVATLPEKDAQLAKSFFTVIRRNSQARHLEIVPYYEAYRDDRFLRASSGSGKIGGNRSGFNLAQLLEICVANLVRLHRKAELRQPGQRAREMIDRIIGDGHGAGTAFVMDL